MTVTPFITIPAGAALADYSSANVTDQVINTPAWVGAARYTKPLQSHLAKWLTPTERDRLHRARKAIVLVYESFQTRPLAGYNGGLADAAAAMEFALDVHYPEGATLMAAVDIDAQRQIYPLTPGNLAAIGAYLNGYADGLAVSRYYDPGLYGDYEAIELFKGRSKLNWQMGARSFSHGLIHPAAHLVQYPEAWKATGLAHLGDDYTGPHSGPGIDSNVCLRPFRAWLPTEVADPIPQPKPPTYHPEQEPDMPAEAAQMIRDRRYSLVLLVGAGTPEWLTGERVARYAADGVPGPIVLDAHPSFPILAARAGVTDLAQFELPQ